MRIYIAKEDRVFAEKLLEGYEPYVYQGTAEKNLAESKKLKREIVNCRFCKKDRTQTSFKQDTHLISKLLGNKHYYSNDECDQCNQLFRLYENDLANYLGTMRVFDHFVKDIKAPGFESANGNIRIKKLPSEVILLGQQKDINDIQVNFNSGEAKVNIHSQQYRPDYVYRALVKMGFSALPEIDINKYYTGIKILLAQKNPPETHYLKKIVIVETDLTLAKPFIQIFKKKIDCKKIQYPQHIVCLYAGRLMFQFFLPGHENQIPNPPTGFIMPTAPYVQLDLKNGFDGIIRNRAFEDLSSSIPTTKNNSLQFSFLPENLAVMPLGFDINELLKKKL